jgi:hypothetical protein
MGKINWDEPYGEHFGGRTPARFTQDGKDYDCNGFELDGDGNVVEEKKTEPAKKSGKPGVGPADYVKLKERIGEEAYNAMKGADKKAAILEFKNAQ